MKPCFRKAGALVLAVLLSCSAGIAAGHHLGQHAAASWQKDGSGHHSAVDVYSFFLPGNSEQAKSGYLNGKSGISLAKQHYKGFFSLLAVADRLRYLILTKYQKEACTFPVRLRKADLIFPFHYFR